MPLKPVAGLLAVVLTFAVLLAPAAGSASEGGALRTIASAPPVAINLSELLGDENEPEEDENEDDGSEEDGGSTAQGGSTAKGERPQDSAASLPAPLLVAAGALGLVAVALAVRLLRRLRAWVGRMGRAAG